MKEMCRNFVCNNSRCPRAAANSPWTEAVPSEAEMGDCNRCVMERIGLAQAFVPSQPFGALQEQEQSLVCGTVFPELVMPYCSGWNLYRFGKEA